ncbi:MAG: GAF domain-containing protein [Burkholderiaceae bacterium]|nr:GAF domain-containing protein [Burkholderiaceae bacterium]
MSTLRCVDSAAWPPAAMAQASRRDEAARVARLHAYARGASRALDDFTMIAQTAATLCGTPGAMISMLDQGHWWNLASSGWEGPVRGLRRGSLCERTCMLGGLLAIADARAEACWDAEPLVQGPPHVRCFAAVPIVTADGLVLGMLAVAAPSPRLLGHAQKSALQRLAMLAMALLELRASARPGMLAALVDRSGDEIYLVEMPTLRLVFTSETARERLGYGPERLAALRAPALSVAYQRPLFMHLRQLARPGLGGYYALETEHMRADGAVYAVQMRAQAGLDHDGTLWSAMLKDLLQAAAQGQGMREPPWQPAGATLQGRDLVSRMATFAGLGGGAPQPIDAVAVLERVLAGLRAALPAEVGLTFESALELAPLLADPAQLELLVSSLCSNMLESIDGIGAMTVHLAGAPTSPGYLWLRVSCDGEVLAPLGPDRGQGLPVVLAAVSLLRGEIQVDSNPGGGVSFNLYFPFAFGIPTGLAAMT